MNDAEDKDINKLNLIYKLNGDFADGVDIFELSPVLLSIGQIILESQKTILPDKEPVSINVKPFRNGSFEIEIVMFAKSHFQQVLTFIRSQTGKDIAEVLGYIGLISVAGSATIAAPTMTLIKLIKWLKGKPKSVEKEKSGKFKYIDNSDNSVSVPIQVHALYQNINIQQTIYNGIAKPLESEKVKNIECCIKNAEETKTLIEKDIIEPIKQYSVGEIPSSEKIIESETSPIKMWVHPHRGSYEGESNSWSFRIVGSNENIKIDTIEDIGFLESIKSDRYRPSHNDRWQVEIIEKQKIQGKKEFFSRKIIKIHDVIKSEEQLSINFENKN
jgi:hypothetical protein